MIESKELSEDLTSYSYLPEDKRLIKTWFYHPPKGDQSQRYSIINAVTREAAEEVIRYCPPSAEKTLALRALQQARMWANAAIAVNEG